MSDRINTDQACKILKTSRQTLQLLRDSGELPFEKISTRKILYNRADVEGLARSKRVEQIRKFQQSRGVFVE